MLYDTLCLSGGGINGFSIIGGLKYLSDKNILVLEKIKKFIGTSAGSIICLFIVIGYDCDTIIKILYQLDLDKIKFDFNLHYLLENYGLDNGAKIITIIQTLIYNKLKLYDITFNELYKRTNKTLKIIVVNYTTREEKVLSHLTTPEMSIILAIRMSISVPFVFTPVKYKNNLYIDGGMSNNFGLEYCELDKTIGICLEFYTQNNTPDGITNILDYFFGILCIFMKNTTIKKFDHDNIIVLNSVWEINKYNADKDYKLYLFKHGYHKTKEYCINNINFIATKIVNNIMSGVFNELKNPNYPDYTC
jgi:predicted acylesterase/phospholipase RssA